MSSDASDDRTRLEGRLLDLDVEKGKEPDWTIGVTGRRYYPFNPDASAISLKEIGNNLANQCRYHGAIDQFFSVAQHLVLAKRVADILRGNALGPDGLLYVLLHDGGEAYMGDMIRPMKLWLRDRDIEAFDEAESLWQALIHEHFGLSPTVNPETRKVIDEVDEFLRYWELSRLKPPYAGWDALYGSYIRPHDFPAHVFEEMTDEEGRFWSPEKSRRIFMKEAQELLVRRGPVVYPNSEDGFPRYL